MKLPFSRPAFTHISVELLSAFLDNQVSPVERARVEGHLRDCAACRAELASLRQTVAVMRALPRVSVPHAFTLSEATVGIRPPAPKAAWLGGLVRGLGAVTAIVLVAVVATTVLRPPAATPAPSVARTAPTAALAEQAGEPAAPMAVPAEKAVELPAALTVPAAAPEQPQALTVTEGSQDMPVAVSAQDAPAAETIQPEAVPGQALESAPAARGVAPAATAAPAALVLAPPEPAAAAASNAKTSGMGGGLAPALPAELLTPEPTPPVAAVANVLPEAARLVYADSEALWAVDRAAGTRQLAAAEGLHAPLIAPDGSYVVYLVPRQDYMALWGVPWDGDAPKLLLDERELPKEGLGVHTERRLLDVRWIPGRPALALNIVRVPPPGATEVLPQVELWELDIETDALRYLAPLGRAYRPLYAPDGSQFALLEYGTEADPQGKLTLFAADGSNRRLALSFPASPAKLSYDDQIAWLPDSSALWLAIPAADPPGPGRFNGMTLYRIDAAGLAEEMGSVDAFQAAWSPDGARLAFLRVTSDTLQEGELYLADADGSGAHRYAAVKDGAFIGWAPDSRHFLYRDNYQTYLGTIDGAPQRLGTSVSFVNPRWVTDTQFVSLHDTGTGWLLTLRGVDGAAYGLLELPREALLDVRQP